MDNPVLIGKFIDDLFVSLVNCIDNCIQFNSSFTFYQIIALV